MSTAHQSNKPIVLFLSFFFVIITNRLRPPAQNQTTMTSEIRPPSSSSSSSLSPSYGSTANTNAVAVDETLTVQDQALDQLSVGVRSVRNIAVDINKEVDSQLTLLDNLDSKIDRTATRIQQTTTRAANNTESAFTIRNFCILLWPLVLLIVLLVEAVIHFLF